MVLVMPSDMPQLALNGVPRPYRHLLTQKCASNLKSLFNAFGLNGVSLEREYTTFHDDRVFARKQYCFAPNNPAVTPQSTFHKLESCGRRKKHI